VSRGIMSATLAVMETVDTLAILTAIAFSAAVGLVMFKYHREIADALENFRNNWPRGGPGSPMHPSSARDSDFLRRKARKPAQ
jgi:hypothetical protein